MRRLAVILALFLTLPANAGRTLNGSTDKITANGISTALDISTGPETVSFWMYPTGTIGSTEHDMVDHWNTASGGQFTVGLGAYSQPLSSVGYAVGCCGVDGPSYSYCGTITPNKWYQVVVWIDPSGTYFGSPATGLNVSGGTTCAVNAIYSTTRSPGQANLTIGNQDTVHGGLNLPFAGTIAEVAVWNVILSPGQRTSLAQICPVGPTAKRAGFPKPVGYFPLTGGSGSSVEPDLSGNVLNGTLSGTSAGNHAPCTP